jgi:methyltransferase (TIGR00027 family)
LAIDEGADTILNLGAGLDTRPHRMTLPASLTWIEADYPHVIDYKEQRLAGEIPACRLTRVRCDLSDGSARRRLLTDADSQAKKLLILTEGVVPYLTLDDVAALAGDLRKLRHAKYWLVDYFSPTLLKYRRRQIGDRMRNAPFRFAPADWFGFFADHGWQLREVRYLLDEADLRKRQPKLPVLPALVTTVRRLFMSKRQRDISRKFAGFSLLEPDAAVQQ